MSSAVLWVILGGMVGAIARYLVTLLFAGKPVGTAIINLVGSFLIGLLVHIPTEWQYGITIGFLGAFTTFSTFQLEVWQMWQMGDRGKALGYWLVLPCLGFGAVELGIWLKG